MALLGFLSKYGVSLALIAAVGFLWADNRGLRQDLKNALVDRKLLEEAIKKGATPEKPIVVNVPVPGGGGVTTPVTVYVQPPQPPSPAAPGQPAQPAQPPRLVAETPPVYCRTKEACDEIYRRAPQSLDVEAQITVGTVVEVCLEPLGQAGHCAPERKVSLPLATPLKFKAQFVLAERGVFTGLNVPGSPLEITKVRTSTQIDVPIAPPGLPYHVGLEAGFLGRQGFAGAVYQNRAFGGFYRAMVGYGFPDLGLTGGVFFTLPLR